MFGSFQAWGDWLAAARTGGLPGMPIEAGNVSLLALAERGLGLRLGPLPALATALAALTALGVRRRRAAPPASSGSVLDDLPVAAAGCLVFLLSSPLVWLHYLILSVPAVILLLRARPPRQWLATGAFAAIAMDPFTDLLGLENWTVQASVMVAGVLMLFALVLAEIAEPSRSRTDSQRVERSPAA